MGATSISYLSLFISLFISPSDLTCGQRRCFNKASLCQVESQFRQVGGHVPFVFTEENLKESNHEHTLS
jgi:hypothetical protein